MKSIGRKATGLGMGILLILILGQPFAVSASPVNPLCGNLDLLHGLIIGETSPGSYKIIDGNSLWNNACANAPSSSDATSYSQTQTLLAQKSLGGQTFSEYEVQYSATQTNGVSATGTMYEVLYYTSQPGYELSIMSYLIGTQSVTSINYVPTTTSSSVLLGDSILTTVNTNYGRYFGLLQQGVQFLASGYLTSQNATLQTLGQRYLTIANSLNNLQQFVQKTPISSATVISSSTLVVDSAATCLTCEVFVASALIVGCFALCFFSGGTLCSVCTYLIELALIEGSELACQAIHWCP
jgi:hypothetical protein